MHEVRVRKVLSFEYVLSADTVTDPAFLTPAGAEDQADLERSDPFGTAIDAYLEAGDRDSFTVISCYVDVKETPDD